MSKKIIYTHKAPKPVGPYSQAVEANGVLFLSGQYPIRPDTGEVFLGDIKTQARIVLDNLVAVVKSAGYGAEQVVKVNIFMTDLSKFPEVNEVYKEYFNNDFPARNTVGVSSLPKGAGIGIEAIAVRS